MGSDIDLSLHLVNILLALCLFTSAYAFMDMEELKSIYYGLDILNEPVVINQKTPSGSVQVTSKYGQQYQCTFPDHSEAEKKKEEEEKVAVETGIVEMLKSMKSQDCLVKTKDWWTYEFCFGKSVRQYHLEADGNIKGNVIHLGFYDSDFDWSNETAKEERLKTTLASYHSQIYNQGDKCDLTGQPRKVEVRFMCEENSEDFMSRIEESETCVYTMTVVTARVCRHPYLRPPVRRRAVPITCNPVLSQAEYNDYLAEINERKEAAKKYKQDQREKKEDLRRRKSAMDQDLEEALLKTAKDVLSEPKGSLFPEPGEDGKVSKESFQKMFGSNDQLWDMYQKGLELSKKNVEERKKKLKELRDLQQREGIEKATEKEDSDEDGEDEEVFSEFYNEIDDIKKRFKRTQKKLSNIKQKLSNDRSWEANIEKAIKEAEEELGMKLDRTLVAGLSSTLNKLVNKLQDTENELSSMDEEINGLKPGDKMSVVNDEESGQKLSGSSNPATSSIKTAGDVDAKLQGDGDGDSGDEDSNDEDEDGKKVKDGKLESNIVKGDGFDQDSGDKWKMEKPQDDHIPTAKQSAPKTFDDKIKSPPKSSADQNDMDYSDKKLEVPSTFPLPKDASANSEDTPPSETPEADGLGQQGADHQAGPDFKLAIDELEDEDDGNKIPSNIKELLEETVRKEYEKKIVRKSTGKLGLDDDHSFIQDKSVHVIQQEDKDGNTNKFIVVLGFKNMDEEIAEQDRQLAMEENYGFVYNKGTQRGGGSGVDEEGEGVDEQPSDQPMR